MQWCVYNNRTKKVRGLEGNQASVNCNDPRPAKGRAVGAGAIVAPLVVSNQGGGGGGVDGAGGVGLVDTQDSYGWKID